MNFRFFTDASDGSMDADTLNTEDDPLIAQTDWRELFGFDPHPGTRSRWRKAGILPPAIRIGRKNYDRRSSIVRFIEARGVQS